VGQVPKQATLHFHNWGLYQGKDQDAAGLRPCGLRGMARGFHVLTLSHKCSCGALPEVWLGYKAPATLGGFPG